MLNSLEYLLPLCSVYCMVIISVDRWTNYCTEIGKRFFFFLTDQRLLANWLCEKIKKYVGGVVYIDLHNPGSAVKQSMILAWIPKIIGRNCLLFFHLFYFLKCQCWFIFKRPSPKRTEINWTFHLFHSSSRTKTIALKICLCKRESSCYPNCWYIYIG